MIRIRLFFDDRHLLTKSQRTQGLRRCWFLLKPDITSIRDLAAQLRQSFSIRDRIVLFKEDFTLPSFESTCIINENDIIRIKRMEAKQSDGKSQVHLQGNDKEDSALCLENSIHIDPLVDASTSKQKRKRSKKLIDQKAQCEEVNFQNEFEPSNDSDVRKKKQVTPQTIHSSSIREEGVVPCDIEPGNIGFQPKEHDSQLADDCKILNAEHDSQQADEKLLHFDGESSVQEQDGNIENTFPQTVDNNQFLNANVAQVSDGVLPLQKIEMLQSSARMEKPSKLVRYESLSHLHRLPVKGDIITYRFVLPSPSVYSELSSPQVGMVSSFDFRTAQTILLPVLEYGILSEENPCGTIVQRNAIPYKEDGSLEIEFSLLADVRLLKAYDSQEENACKDDQEKKDNWEEALNKGNRNEFNVSTAEQNNGWALWIPNQSLTETPRSFEQSLAAAHRGGGRGSGSRVMDRGRGRVRAGPYRAPYRYMTNWNPNRNNL